MTLTDLWKQAKRRLGDRNRDQENVFHPMYIWIPALFSHCVWVWRSLAPPQMHTWQKKQWTWSLFTPLISSARNVRGLTLLLYCIHRHTHALCSPSAVKKPDMTIEVFLKLMQLINLSFMSKKLYSFNTTSYINIKPKPFTIVQIFSGWQCCQFFFTPGNTITITMRMWSCTDIFVPEKNEEKCNLFWHSVFCVSSRWLQREWPA